MQAETSTSQLGKHSARRTDEVAVTSSTLLFLHWSGLVKLSRDRCCLVLLYKSQRDTMLISQGTRSLQLSILAALLVAQPASFRFLDVLPFLDVLRFSVFCLALQQSVVQARPSVRIMSRGPADRTDLCRSEQGTSKLRDAHATCFNHWRYLVS